PFRRCGGRARARRPSASSRLPPPALSARCGRSWSSNQRNHGPAPESRARVHPLPDARAGPRTRGPSMSSSAAANVPSDAAPARTVVHKFGGTSVADADRYRHVATLLRAREETLQVTVVSAMKGVTDALIELAQAAGADAPEWRGRWQLLRERQHEAAGSLLGEGAGPLLEWLDQRFEELLRVLQAMGVIGSLPEEVLQRVQGLGEVYSARLLGEYLCALGEDCAVLDAREVLVVSHGELGVDVDWERSAQRLQQWRQANPQRRGG